MECNLDKPTKSKEKMARFFLRLVYGYSFSLEFALGQSLDFEKSINVIGKYSRKSQADFASKALEKWEDMGGGDFSSLIRLDWELGEASVSARSSSSVGARASSLRTNH